MARSIAAGRGRACIVNPEYPHIGRPQRSLDPAGWDERYAQGDTPWDHGAPAPGLVEFLARTDAYRPGRVLVPGCGAGHDCRELARGGFAVTGIDVAPRALAAARTAGDPDVAGGVTYRLADFLDLPADLRGAFGWVFEHTCFCAIDPARRDDYVDAAATALQPGGFLLGIFFDMHAETGPPFGARPAELHDRFSRRFTLVREWTPASWENRRGEELMQWWQRT